MIAAGFDNGDVNMFDLRNMKLQWSTNVGNGVCSLQYDRMGNYIYKRLIFNNLTKTLVVLRVVGDTNSCSGNFSKTIVYV